MRAASGSGGHSDVMISPGRYRLRKLEKSGQQISRHLSFRTLLGTANFQEEPLRQAQVCRRGGGVAQSAEIGVPLAANAVAAQARGRKMDQRPVDGVDGSFDSVTPQAAAGAGRP
jgi:hypothetical protein